MSRVEDRVVAGVESGFLSADPVQTLELILHGKVRRGAPKKEDRRNIEIVAAVKQRRRRGMTLEDACLEVSKEQVTRRNPIGRDGVRRIYEILKMKKKGGLWSIVLVEASCIEERANAKATSRYELGGIYSPDLIPWFLSPSNCILGSDRS